MNEAETRADLIDPLLVRAGWGVVEGSRIRREFPITLGRLKGAGRREPALSADYVFEYRNQKIAVMEAKSDEKPLTQGVGQAKDYADKLALRFAYASNGKGFYAIDMHEGTEGEIESFPAPDDLWNRLFPGQKTWVDRFNEIAPPDKSGQWTLRFYQELAMNRVLEKISDEEKRILLTLATGTGKTSIAFHIAWKLFSARWNRSGEPTRQPRILFLADRNTLADQAFNDFAAFNVIEDKAMCRIDPASIKKQGSVPKNASFFFTIFQTFMSGTDAQGNPAPSFGQYPADFFDFIVVDECHRGGANDESTWRAILEYFEPAVQLGLTATPKRTENVDTYQYFGEPVYTYSLKEGINDGFLTPFKVRQISTTLDEYTHTSDDDILEGEIEEGRTYTESEINRVIEIMDRERHRVELFMGMIDQREKTLVFCATQEHALAVRDLINQIAESKDPNYCHRVTADEGKIGDQHLRDFQDNEKSIPTILTTSQKLSTGVDARNVRNIVLMRPINSMIEFKQIIGRGTRLYDGKDYFTVYDFVKAHQHFQDEEWDGEPLEPEACSKCGQRPCACIKAPPQPCAECGQRPCICERDPRPAKIKVKLSDGKRRSIQNMSVTSFWHPDGRPISAQEFMQLLYGELPHYFHDEAHLRELWSDPSTRAKLLEGLSEAGFGKEQLTEMQRIIDARDSDLFDVLAFVAYAKQPRKRTDRAAWARNKIEASFDAKQRSFLEFVLSHYEQQGVQELDSAKLEPLIRLRYKNSLADALKELGGPAQVREAFIGFQKFLYEPSADP